MIRSPLLVRFLYHCTDGYGKPLARQDMVLLLPDNISKSLGAGDIDGESMNMVKHSDQWIYIMQTRIQSEVLQASTSSLQLLGE